MKFRHYDNTQAMLFPPALEDFIPSHHLVRALDAIVEQLDLTKLYESYSEEGQPGYHPKLLLKLLLYGYATGVRSSRKIAQKIESDVCFMYLAAMQRPDFRTISDFRMQKRAYLEGYFLQVLRLCQEMGMVTLGHIAIDGTKLHASAARHRTKDREWVIAVEEKLQEKIQSVLDTAQQADKEDDSRYGVDTRGDELPEELRSRERFVERLKQAKTMMEKQNMQRINITDPDARLMRTPEGGTGVCYNSQIVVDAEKKVIVACDVTSQEDDHQQFIPLYEQAVKNTNQVPRETSADAGYHSGAVYLYLEKNDIEAYLPDAKFHAETDEEGNEQLPPFDRRRFRYDEHVNGYRCPADQVLSFVKNSKRNGVRFAVYQGTTCATCTLRQQCIAKPQAVNRQIQIYENDGFKAQMRAKLHSPEGKQRYLKRLTTVEPVFAQLKHILGFRKFLVRGIEKVQAEFKLLCIAYNMKKLAFQTMM